MAGGTYFGSKRAKIFMFIKMSPSDYYIAHLTTFNFEIIFKQNIYAVEKQQ